MMYLEIAIAILFIMLVWNVMNTYMKDANSPPGPFPLPIIGNMHQIGVDISSNFGNLIKQYPGVMMLRFPLGDVLVLSNAAAVEEAFVTRKSDFAGRFSEKYPLMLILGNDIINADYGEMFKFHRRLFKTAFQTSGEVLPYLDRTLHGAIRQLLKLVKDTQQRPFSCSKPIQYMSILQLWQRLAGVSLSFEDPIVHKIIDLLHEHTTAAKSLIITDLFPILKYFPNRISQRVDYVVKLRDELLESVLIEHQKTYKEGLIRDVTDAFLAGFNSEEERRGGKRISDPSNIKFLMNDVLVGGIDTSASLLQWVILYLVMKTEIQEKVQQELDENMPGDSLPYSSDVKNFHYLNATLAEVLRVVNLIPFLVPHKTTCDTQVMGYNVPKNTMVIVDQRSLHYDPMYWSEPDVFKPERFLDEQKQFVGWNAKRSFIPFGLGRRSCPGQDLAKVHNIIAIACLLHSFSFRLPNNEALPKINTVRGVTTAKVDYFEVIATKRK